ncbi:DNA mismatch endonuclease Vsr [Chitinophaga oryziterrae]|uniref:Very short patch repair endonuclease n=2 Tax=Chitinophaga oryziterrae TaxID=1031224 RepID=A0A6N8J8B4_9BACT|nr:DNA mismatch endonuclease Vsr [Chitinophaga oryziterrae]MVT41480.1 DNA mismatch endonuclease Vsr [Chitinophaga oryziterrae]
MADVHSQEVRSFNMSKIKGKDTKPELLVRKFLFSHGFRYRLHDKKLPGKPDMVFPKYKTVLFINGCFWHGHDGCKYFVVPKTRTEWWLNKITGNKNKDVEHMLELKENGWNVIIVWECQLKPSERDVTLQTLLNELKNNERL